MEKKFELDLTQAVLPSYWSEHQLPLKIPLRPSQWESDFDVDDIKVNRLAHEIEQIIGDHEKPVGVKVLSIPVGAVIRRLPD